MYKNSLCVDHVAQLDQYFSNRRRSVLLKHLYFQVLQIPPSTQKNASYRHRGERVRDRPALAARELAARELAALAARGTVLFLSRRLPFTIFFFAARSRRRLLLFTRRRPGGIKGTDGYNTSPENLPISYRAPPTEQELQSADTYSSLRNNVCMYVNIVCFSLAVASDDWLPRWSLYPRTRVGGSLYRR